MSELEDLRNRSLIWRTNPSNTQQCQIHEGLQEIGTLKRESLWRSTYTAELAGLEWRLKNRSRGLKSVLRLDFADGKRGLAEATRSGMNYEAVVDGVSLYSFERTETLRGVWRDRDGYVVVSIDGEENQPIRFRLFRQGAIRAFEACPVAHAPALILLALVPVMYDWHFFSEF